MANPVEPGNNLSQYQKKCAVIGVVLKNIFTPITACRDVVKRVGKFYAEGAGHGEREYNREFAT